MLFFACAAGLFYFLYPRTWFFVAFLGCCVAFVWGLRAGEPFIVMLAMGSLAICWYLDRPQVRSRIMRVFQGNSSSSDTAGQTGEGGTSDRALSRDERLRLQAKGLIRKMQDGMLLTDLTVKYGFTTQDAVSLLRKLNQIGIGCPECGKAWRHPSPRCPHCGAATGLIVEPE